MNKFENSSDSNYNTNLAANIWRTLLTFPETGIYKDLENFLKEKLANKNLVDLGVGQAANIPTLENLTKLGIKKYQAVEKYLDSIEEEGGEKSSEAMANNISKIRNGGLEAEFFKEDMLEFVSKLVDSSSNFSILAIDKSVISSDKYWLDLAREIERTTETGGIIISKNSSIGNFLNKEIFKESNITSQEDNLYLVNIFEKIA